MHPIPRAHITTQTRQQRISKSKNKIKTRNRINTTPSDSSVPNSQILEYSESESSGSAKNTKNKIGINVFNVKSPTPTGEFSKKNGRQGQTQNRSSTISARRTVQQQHMKTKNDSDDSFITELQPSSTIGRQKRKGLNQSWENIFQTRNHANQNVKSSKTKKYMQPKIFYHQLSNQAIGVNILSQTESSEMETIWFHNINGKKDEKNWAQIITTMKENNIDIFGFAEINKTMESLNKNRWQSMIRKQFT
jgi:hypothetical protein